MVKLGASASQSATATSRSAGIGRLSIGAIDRVAKALGISAVGLLAGLDGETAIDIVRRAERTQFQPFDHGVGAGSAVTRRAGQLGVIEFVGGPTEFASTPFVHRNDSVCLILAGTYEFEIEGVTVRLHEGDSVSASGGVRERYRILETPARMLLIFVSEDVEVVHRPSAAWPTR